ncbi:hypothetical protein P409_00860 [Inquilinus limosus MP06]|uniref:WG repeat-containing protein n=1 Tax=Inquilinus limosus MP06 TaxID=1398085 RepID=A0A0A0DD41_9PROT|nr:hypothetical protein P409_00860 [Inquilinus limosus MP06]
MALAAILLVIGPAPARSAGPGYDCTDALGRSACNWAYSEGLAAVQIGPEREDGPPRWGYLDASGRMVVEPAFDDAEGFSNGLAAVQVKGLWGYIDPKGAWVIEPRFQGATSFNGDGTAIVESDGRHLLIDRQGRTVRTLPPGWRLGRYGFEPGQPLASILVPVAPLLWNAATGLARDLPEDVMDVGLPQGGLVPAQRRETKYGGRWGYLDESGRWAIAPEVLGSTMAPRSDGGTVAIYHDDGWWFVDAAGKPLSGTGYRSVELLMPGTWLATTKDGTQQILDDKAAVVRDLGQYPSLVSFGRWSALAADDAVLLIGAKAEIRAVPADHPEIEAHGDVLWISEPSDASDGGPTLVQILDRDGRPLLDDATVKALNGYSAYPVSDGDAAGAADALPLPFATLLPKDYRAPGGILTAKGRIVTNPDWDDIGPGGRGDLLLRVQTVKGSYGAIDGDGGWVVPPTLERLSGFGGGYAVARDQGGEAVRPVLIDGHGRRRDVPRSVIEEAQDISSGCLLYSRRAEGGSVGWGLWDIEAGKVLVEPTLEEIKPFDGGYALARQAEAWGVLDRQGRWVIPPRIAGYGEPERLDDGVYVAQSSKPLRPGGGPESVYRLASVAAGGEIGEDLRDKPERLAANRFLIKPASGGAALVDGAGKVLLRSDAAPDRTEMAGDWIVLRFDDRYGAIDSRGEWRVPPRYVSAIDFVQPEGLASASVDGGSVLLDQDGKAGPAGLADASPLAGMGRLVRNDEDKDETVLMALDGAEILRLPGRYAVETSDARGGLVPFKSPEEKYGFLDAGGKRVIGAYFDRLGPMEGDRAFAMQSSRSGQAYGYIDRTGRFVIRPRYEWATSFSDGRALVSEKGVPQFIDASGRVVARFLLHCGRPVVADGKSAQIWPKQKRSCPTR